MSELDIYITKDFPRGCVLLEDVKEIQKENTKWLSYVIKLEDKLEMLTECDAIDEVDEASIYCYCQGCKNANRLKKGEGNE